MTSQPSPEIGKNTVAAGLRTNYHDQGQGFPVNAVAWLANTLGRLGIGLKAGEVILSGALAAMFPAKAGDHFRVTIGGLGACSVRFD